MGCLYRGDAYKMNTSSDSGFNTAHTGELSHRQNRERLSDTLEKFTTDIVCTGEFVTKSKRTGCQISSETHNWRLFLRLRARKKSLQYILPPVFRQSASLGCERGKNAPQDTSRRPCLSFPARGLQQNEKVRVSHFSESSPLIIVKQ